MQEGLSFHTIWTAVITVAGGIVAFFTKRLIDEVDKKANQSDLDDIKDDIKALFARQDEQHKSNTERLDRIIMAMSSSQR